MSTIFDIRSLKPPKLSGRTLLIGSLVTVFALIAAIAGAQLYTQLTTNTVVAYFSETLGLYPGDKVQIMGVRVGAIDKIEPAGDKMRVTFHYLNRYKVPAEATASILNPSLVASRVIQLSPAYSGGPTMKTGAVIPSSAPRCPSSGMSYAIRSTGFSASWARHHSSRRDRSATSSNQRLTTWPAREHRSTKP